MQLDRTNIVKIGQLDGNQTISSNQSSDNHSDNELSENSSIVESTADTEYGTDEEIDPEPIPANFFPVPNQNIAPGQPITLDVHVSGSNQPTSMLPLCMMLNSRSLYNKCDNFRTLLQEIGPDLTIVSETWEREIQSLDSLLSPTEYKTISYCRKRRTKNRQPGGGCAIIYNSNRFTVEKIDVSPPENVEAVWAFFTPHRNGNTNCRVKKIAVGAIYAAPNSQHKQATIDHIIETMHFIRSTQDNVHFLFGGDLNRLQLGDILESYGALKQFISVPTRNNATLEIILTDLHSFYHPPTTLPPLQIDSDKIGADSDHNTIVMAPLANDLFKVERVKKTITIRPLPTSKIKDVDQSRLE